VYTSAGRVELDDEAGRDAGNLEPRGRTEKSIASCVINPMIASRDRS
jgi:hypothetical protein